MIDIRFLVVEPLDIPQHDLRSGDWIARTIARERQTSPISYPHLKPGKIVRVYRASKIAYLKAN